MRVAYITEQGAVIYKKGRRLVVVRNREILATLRATHLDQVVLWGHVRVTPGALAVLMDQGVDTVFVSSYGRFRGRIVGPFSKNILLRWSQFERAHEDAFALHVARAIVEAKVHNARTLLRHRLRHMDEPVLREGIAHLRRVLHEIPYARDLDHLRGLEGEAAHVYFQALGESIRVPAFRFTHRTRRPPRDPTNALLSLLYTMLLIVVSHAVHVVGLDPYLGVFHQKGHGKPSLALDLMEEFRAPLVDALVLRIIERGVVQPEDFESRPSGHADTSDEAEPATPDEPPPAPVWLTSSSLKKVIAIWESACEDPIVDPQTGHTLTKRRLILEQARRMAHAYREGVDYVPFRWQ